MLLTLTHQYSVCRSRFPFVQLPQHHPAAGFLSTSVILCMARGARFRIVSIDTPLHWEWSLVIRDGREWHGSHARVHNDIDEDRVGSKTSSAGPRQTQRTQPLPPTSASRNSWLSRFGHLVAATAMAEVGWRVDVVVLI
jgi:hypothetical protein